MLFEHEDFLAELSAPLSLSEKLRIIHHALRRRLDFISRVAVALYDEGTQSVKTFLASADEVNALIQYEVPISTAPALERVLISRQPRVVTDLRIFAEGNAEHTRKIKHQGYACSYTFPMQHNQRVAGFIFFNGNRADCFDETALDLLPIFGHLITQIIVNELGVFRNVLAALRTTSEIIHLRDPETGMHLERMSRFARLIAQEMAKSGKYSFSDEYIEHLFMFAPMHDIGKVCIPDKILMKPGKLDQDERKVIETHTVKGRQLVDTLMQNFNLDGVRHISMLCNIIELHHETLDGKGYPHGLAGDEVPIEAQIVAVADIFDALTSVRSYKTAWRNDEAAAYLQQRAGMQLHPDCVNALIANLEQVAEIQATFPESLENQSNKLFCAL
jgi:HD-GYP domain-containing protein (c-di-GMP phosphodiesterase class II)